MAAAGVWRLLVTLFSVQEEMFRPHTWWRWWKDLFQGGESFASHTTQERRFRHWSLEEKELRYFRFIEVVKPILNVHKAFGCVCLRWYTGTDLDLTLNISLSAGEDNISADEKYVIIIVSSILSIISSLSANSFILSFTKPLPWPLHRFYINRFFTTKVLKVYSASDNSESSHRFQ